MRKNIIILLFLFFMPRIVWSACTGSSPTWTTTPDYSSVSSCVSGAKVGDTINISAGAGSVDWASKLTITKGINLTGPGMSNLAIRNTNSTSTAIILYNPSDYSTNSAFELSGFTFDSNGRYGLTLGTAPKTPPFAENTNIKIHDNTFTDSSGTGNSGGGIWSFGSLYGVIYRNVFTNFEYPTKNDPNNNGPNFNEWWTAPPQSTFALGSYRYLYWEDNVFSGPVVMITDGQYSARYVYRYNTVNTTANTTIQLWEIHGEQTATPMASCFGAELYGNKITSTVNNYVGLWYQRSGQTRIFYNYVGTSGGITGGSYYTGSITSPCPASQIADKIIHNSYAWNNKPGYTGSDGGYYADQGLNCGGYTNVPTLGRDVITPSSTPGITCGTLANRPATCTTGQGYWATNQSCTNLTGLVGASTDVSGGTRTPTTYLQGSLYKCVSTNTWSTDGDGVTYTPYTYPHPLRDEGMISPPKDLRISN